MQAVVGMRTSWPRSAARALARSPVASAGPSRLRIGQPLLSAQLAILPMGSSFGESRRFASTGHMDTTGLDALLASGGLPEPVHDPIAIVGAVQTVLESVHTTTGLPWWATLALSGVTLRAAVFPFYIYQIHAMQRLMQARPDFSKLYSAYKYARTFLPARDTKGHLDAVLLGRKGVQLIMKKYETRPVQTVLGSLVHIPLFILMAYSARDMIRHGNFEGLDTGGLLYWINLKETDETFVLPLLAAGSTYLNIELGLRNKSAIWTTFGQGMQYLPLVATPFIAALPQGVFFYWIPSTWAAIVQTVAMDNNAFRRSIGLKPRMTLPASAAAQPMASENQEEADSDAPSTQQKEQLDQQPKL